MAKGVYNNIKSGQLLPLHCNQQADAALIACPFTVALNLPLLKL